MDGTRTKAEKRSGKHLTTLLKSCSTNFSRLPRNNKTKLSRHLVRVSLLPKQLCACLSPLRLGQGVRRATATRAMASSDPASQPPLLLPPPEHAPVAPLPVPEPRPRPSPTVGDHVRGLLRSGEAFIRGVFESNSGHTRPHLQQHQHQHQHHLHQQQQYHPHQNRAADIMKRLQRETFPDVMKLLDKHEQIERILSLYKSGKGFQFPDLPIRVKIALDAVGALFLIDGNEFNQAKAVLEKAGYHTGLSSRFVFESKTRGKDTIAAELATRLEAGSHLGEAVGRPVELTRLQYLARINKRVSVILVPFGAQCNDLLRDPRMLQSQASFHGPPSFSERHNGAAGLRIKGSRFTASIAELIFGSGAPGRENGGTNRMTTFGQLSCEPAKDVKLSLSGVWQACSPSARFNNLGILAVPVGSMKPGKTAAPGPKAETDLSVDVQRSAGASAPSVAVMVDCELYETIKAEGWFQMERSSHRPVRCGFSLSDTPENKLGWGLRMGGTAEGEGHQLHHQHLEGFLNLSFGKGSLQPGLVYAMDGEKWTPALFLRSSWFM